MFYTSAARNPQLLVLNDTSDQMYQNYFDSLANGVHGERYNILSLMAMGYFDLSRQENAGFTPINDWEAKRRKVNTIYLDTWVMDDYSLTASEEDTLWNIALSSPYTYGDAVFSARVILGIDPDDFHLTYRSPVQEEGIESTFEILVYPNPANEKYCIRLLNSKMPEYQLFTLSLYDISGRQLLSDEIRMDSLEDYCEQTGMLEAGIYIVQLRNHDSGNVYKAKFVVQ